MALQEITGIPADEIPELREEFNQKPEGDLYDLEERYCLYKIPHQPDNYNGPDRYCSARCSNKTNGIWRCRAHKGKGTATEHLKAGRPKHHMYSTPEYLLDHLTDEEQAVYDEIMSWADKYGIDKEEDPAVYDDLQLLAIERVRAIKTSEYILKEGETRQTPVFDAEGNVAQMEDDTNAISEEHRRLINLIQSLKKDLGLTRKEQMKADDRNVMAESADTASEAMNELVNDDEKDFDVTDYEE